jgi:hypothetical protein
MAAQYRTLECRVCGNFRGTAERPLMAALGLIVDGPSSTYIVEKRD